VTIDKAAGQTPVFVNFVSADYFRTMQIRLVRGRVFTDEEAASTAVRPVIVSAALARRFWRDGEELGRRIGNDRDPFEIVGVAEDARLVDLGTSGDSFVYVAARPDDLPRLMIVLRAPGRSAAVAAVAGDLARSLDRNLLVTTERFEDRLERVLQPSRAAATLAAALGLFALLLALVGVYGIVSYSVSLRTHEMGVRLAIGAQPRDIVALVVRQGATPVAAGLIAGTLLAAGAARIIKGLLFGVSSLDPAAYVAVLAAMSAAALLAMCAPARRAAHLDPAVTLRFE
jgi:putative ABC transport system permease protein